LPVRIVPSMPPVPSPPGHTDSSQWSRAFGRARRMAPSPTGVDRLPRRYCRQIGCDLAARSAPGPRASLTLRRSLDREVPTMLAR
jgi:hypothetical protein